VTVNSNSNIYSPVVQKNTATSTDIVGEAVQPGYVPSYSDAD
jgi:hypothetical protein